MKKVEVDFGARKLVIDLPRDAVVAQFGDPAPRA